VTSEPPSAADSAAPGSPVRTEEEFRAFYQGVLLPELESVDRERRAVRGRVLVLWLSLLGLIFLSLLIFGGLQASGPPGAAVVVVVGGIGLALFGFWLAAFARLSRAKRAYIARYKNTVIGHIIRFIEPGLAYEPDSFVAEAVYQKSGLFPRAWDRYRGDDFIHGRAGRTPLFFSELHTEYKTRQRTSDNRTRETWHTIFHGLFFVCEFNKTFQGRTVVLPDRLEGLLGDLGAALQFSRSQYGELVKLEDPEFERMFAVYGSDQVTARYILSTSLMARLMAFRGKARQDIRLAFVDSNLYAAVSFNRDLFEPRVWRSLIDYEEIRGYFEILQLVIGIVEDLSLNTRIWGERALSGA